MTVAFSVCIPIRNESSWLEGAIESVLAQTHADFELVIGDNASDDGIEEVIARFDDPRLVHHRFDELVDVNESWNRTVALCRNEWIHPLSADDRMAPHCLERIAAEIEAHDAEGIVMVAGRVRRVDVDGQPTDIGLDPSGQRRPTPYREVPPGVLDARTWLLANAAPGITPFMPGSVSFRRETVEMAGFFRPDMELVADLEVVLRLSVYGPVVWIDDVLLDYTVRGNSATHRFVRLDLMRNHVTTMSERAWMAALLLHQSRRAVRDDEVRAVHGCIARTLLQRAVWQRRFEVGHGRRAAMRDVIRGIRYGRGSVLASPRILVALGAMVLPATMIDKAVEIGHRYGMIVG